MALYLRVCVWFLLFSTFCVVTYGYADRIYLKDGTVQESERVWLSDKYIHFILNGTTEVAIRYAKEIVDRVVINGVEEKVAATHPAAQPQAPAPIKPKVIVIEKQPSPPSAPAVREQPTRIKIDDQTIIRAHKGISFYNPRRDLRYWVTRDSKHSTLSGALAALAKIYGRSVRWVEANMGDENDLASIHRNLIMGQGKTPDMPAVDTPDQAVSEGLFYNRGLAQPYRIGPNETFKSQSAAVKALAKKYGRNVEWVQDNFGQSNELKTIHDNLTKAMQQSVTPAAPAPEEKIASRPTADAAVKGKAFYNPRRKHKYWIGEEDRFDSLKDALGALALKYGVPVEWIDRHMGDTNDLNQIHQNLQESLK